jgi:GT2 family glycosyltransferase
VLKIAIRRFVKFLLLTKLLSFSNNFYLIRLFQALKKLRVSSRNYAELFDDQWYRATNVDLINLSISEKEHFIIHGEAEGRDPNPFFDTDWYKLNYQDDLEESNLTPLTHYISNKYSHNPNPVFISSNIIKKLPEIVGYNNNPLADFISNFTRYENRFFTNFDYFHSSVGIYYPEIYFPIASCMSNNYCSVVSNIHSHDKRVALIIPVHNKWAYTQRCLDSIIRTNMLSKVDIFVVDDCSTDETANNLSKIPYIKKVITNISNKGYLRSVNTCFKYICEQETKYDYIGVINNDVEFLSNSFDYLVNQLDENPDFGCLSPKVIYPDGRIQEFGALLWEDGSASQLFHNLEFREDSFLKTNHLMESSYVSAACIFLRSSSLSQLGPELFDDLFYPAYYEDVDLCLRIRESGLKVGVFGGSYVVHHEGISHGTNLSIGIKSYQDVNKSKLVSKWGSKLKEFALPKEISLNQVEKNTLLLHSSKKVVLIIDDKLPNPMSGGGEARMKTIIDHLKSLGCIIIFVPVGKLVLSDSKNFYSNFGNRAVGITYLDPVIDEINFYAHNKYETYCLISRPSIQRSLGSYLYDKLSKNTKFIFDTVDLLDMYPEPSNIKYIKFIQDISSYDYIWTVNELEKNEIQKIIPELGNKIDICPMKLDINPGPKFEDTEDLIVVGSLGHPPNQKMVLNAIENIFQGLRKSEDQIHLKVVGAGWQTWLMQEFPNLDLSRVLFKEYVPDISAEIRSSRIMLAPLAEGSGIKIKVLDSIRNGVPVIGSNTAWEGICEAFEVANISISEHSDYISEIKKLYWNKNAWEETQEKQSIYSYRINSKFLANKFFKSLN